MMQMSTGTIPNMKYRKEILSIESMPSLLEKSLALAGLVTRVFKDAGWDLVVVGGSAVEFYTEGSYMSGDIDFCRRNLKPVPLRLAQDLMKELGASGGPRSWKVAGLYVDLLGLLENESTAPCRTVETPLGKVSIMPPELALVERVLLAFYPKPDSGAEAVARKLLAACIGGAVPVDWTEVARLADLPSFGIGKEMARLKKDVCR